MRVRRVVLLDILVLSGLTAWGYLPEVPSTITSCAVEVLAVTVLLACHGRMLIEIFASCRSAKGGALRTALLASVLTGVYCVSVVPLAQDTAVGLHVGTLLSRSPRVLSVLWVEMGAERYVVLEPEDYEDLGATEMTVVRFRPSLGETVGILHGPFKRYHENGELALEAHFRYDVRHGPCSAYYTSGELYWRGRFLCGHRTGAWTVYNEDGSRRAEGCFDARGRPDNRWAYYGPETGEKDMAPFNFARVFPADPRPFDG